RRDILPRDDDVLVERHMVLLPSVEAARPAGGRPAGCDGSHARRPGCSRPFEAPRETASVKRRADRAKALGEQGLSSPSRLAGQAGPRIARRKPTPALLRAAGFRVQGGLSVLLRLFFLGLADFLVRLLLTFGHGGLRCFLG